MFENTILLAQDDGALVGLLTLLIQLALMVLVIAGFWRTFAKAGKPGWAAIVPFYNLIVLLEIAGRPLWWIILWLLPCVNIVIVFIVAIDVAKSFGKDALYGIGLALLPFIFYPLLGFSDARYLGPPAH
ncbi:MAG: DUF5684 domain-containing protein [Pirellulales bacterium]|nr:DUF5684 domain-containing protein [Pirellulales bacterium]